MFVHAHLVGLDIAVTCFEEGLLKEVELSYYAFNCQLTQAIKMELHVRFIQELAVLSVTSSKLNGSALSLFPGQYSSFELLFKNLGDEVIDFLHFNVIESTTVKDDDPMGILFPVCNAIDDRLDCCLRLIQLALIDWNVVCD